ncbi:hypothetical protein BJ508DRAFT_322039 [Ascobolus immersus RN42]|uniref:Uncharacterized protein n=1 Tax=Ascobolus immersus RN42 TaxID=1160509 RepID=A0A3N4IW80_ASCIM|nr:hypothetical protein BJ508DRAFT_322039 [Ascobolus immersus RN42]
MDNHSNSKTPAAFYMQGKTKNCKVERLKDYKEIDKVVYQITFSSEITDINKAFNDSFAALANQVSQEQACVSDGKDDDEGTAAAHATKRNELDDELWAIRLHWLKVEKTRMKVIIATAEALKRRVTFANLSLTPSVVELFTDSEAEGENPVSSRQTEDSLANGTSQGSVETDRSNASNSDPTTPTPTLEPSVNDSTADTGIDRKIGHRLAMATSKKKRGDRTITIKPAGT